MKKHIFLVAAIMLTGVAQLMADCGCDGFKPSQAKKVVTKPMLITIDGPYASGKSTIGQMVADRLGYEYFNSGKVYRAVSYVLANKLGYTQDRLKDLKASDVKTILDSNRLKFVMKNGSLDDVLYDNVSIMSQLRSDNVNAIVYELGKNQAVRQLLADYLHRLIPGSGVVAESYGIGKTFPKADLKIYLTATPQVRAERLKEMRATLGQQLTVEEAKEKIRDYDDRGDGQNVTTREIPTDAKVIDTSSLTKQQVVDAIIVHVNK